MKNDVTMQTIADHVDGLSNIAKMLQEHAKCCYFLPLYALEIEAIAASLRRLDQENEIVIKPLEQYTGK